MTPVEAKEWLKEFLPKRDSRFWSLSFYGGVLTLIATEFPEFIPDEHEKMFMRIAVFLTVMGGKMGWSWAGTPTSPEGPQAPKPPNGTGLWALALAVSLTVSGCAATRVLTGQAISADVSTEGRLAIQARGIVLAMDGLLTATERLVESKVLTPQQALPVAQASEKVGQLGQKLATTLRVVDVANGGAKEAAIHEATGLLTSLTETVSTIPMTTRSLLSGGVETVLGLMAQLRASLP